MALKLLPDGIGATSGPDLVTESPVAYTGNVWFIGPSGSGSNTGLQRTSPFATASQAHTACSAGDTIVWLPGCTENVSVGITCNKIGVTFVSEGLGSDRAALTCTAAIAMFNVTAACVRFINVRFPASTAVPTYRIRSTAGGFMMKDCDVDCGASDTGDQFLFDTGASHGLIQSCTFTATAAGAAIPLSTAAAMTGLTLDDVTFDGGGFTWNVNNGDVFNGSTVTGLLVTGLRLLNGSNFHVPASSTTVISTASDSGESIIYGS